MKKLFYALLVLAGVTMFTACGNEKPNEIDLSKLDNTTNKCWQLTVKVGTQSEVSYVWGTEYMVGLAVEATRKKVGDKATISYKEADAKDEDACERLNPDYEEEACWKITYGSAAFSQTVYMWDDEEDVKAFIAVYTAQGMTASYEKADAKDEDACEKLNEPTQPTDPYANLDNTIEKCWEVTIDHGTMTETVYMWTTERELCVSLDANYKGMYTYKPADANDEDACEKLNDKPGDDFDGSQYDDTTDRCWMVTIKMSGMETVHYVWETEYEMAYAAYQASKTPDVEYKYEQAAANDEDACEALEKRQQADAKCWKLTASFSVMGMPQSQVMYVWVTENDLEMVKESAKQQLASYGVQVDITAEPAEANDEDACEELNDGVIPGGGGDDPQPQGAQKCWKIDILMNGEVLAATYVWCTAEQVNIVAEGIKAQMGSLFAGATLNITEADADDEDSCNALNKK